MSVRKRIGQQEFSDTADEAEVRYQVLCRRHHRGGDLGPTATGGLPRR